MRFEASKDKRLTRRDFVKGAAVGAMGGMVIGAAGTVLAAEPKPAGKAPEAMCAEIVTIAGHKDDKINAYLARPSGPGPHPGIVVIHHMPGWDDACKEITRRFAHNGYAAICPNLQFREGKATPQENSDSILAKGGMPDDRAMGDLAGAIRYLRSQPYLNGKVGIIGYCSGGRQCYLAACTLPGLNAAVACYPGGVGEGPAGLNPAQPVDPLDLTKNLSCPLMGLFGKDDKRPSPEHMAKTEAELKKFGKTYEFHAYDKAGHSFFWVENSGYRWDAALDGWKKVFQWFGKYLR